LAPFPFRFFPEEGADEPNDDNEQDEEEAEEHDEEEEEEEEQQEERVPVPHGKGKAKAGAKVKVQAKKQQLKGTAKKPRGGKLPSEGTHGHEQGSKSLYLPPPPKLI
jgi:hypothetical protein